MSVNHPNKQLILGVDTQLRFTCCRDYQYAWPV